jgi:hypothetical protein
MILYFIEEFPRQQGSPQTFPLQPFSLMSQADDWPELSPAGSVITACPCCNLSGLFGSGITATRIEKIVPTKP